MVFVFQKNVANFEMFFMGGINLSIITSYFYRLATLMAHGHFIGSQIPWNFAAAAAAVNTQKLN